MMLYIIDTLKISYKYTLIILINYEVTLYF